MSEISPPDKVSTDKLPVNFLNIGFIKMILPNSKIIHCERDAKNNCLSIYKNLFYLGDAFYAFFPTMAQGASQSIEAANELFNLLSQDTKEVQNLYFKKRLKKTNQINTIDYCLVELCLGTYKCFL